MIVGEETGRILQQLLQNEFARQMEGGCQNQVEDCVGRKSEFVYRKKEKIPENIW